MTFLGFDLASFGYRRGVDLCRYRRLTVAACIAIFLIFLAVRHNHERRQQHWFSILDELTADGYHVVAASIPSDMEADQLIVPNIVHYVWLGTDLNFTFINYLSFLSVDRFIRPEYILVFGEVVPSGTWWNRVIAEIKNVFHVRMVAPTVAPNGKAFAFPAHRSDFLRFSLILRYGGIYLDADVLVLKSFDPLRRHALVLGRDLPDSLCNGIIIAKRGSPFLRLILDTYYDYEGDSENWAHRANHMPHYLAIDHPEMVHVEERSLNRPNYLQKKIIYDGLYDWSDNFAMHLWVRLWPEMYVPQGPDDIRTRNTTLGEMSRWILYGRNESVRQK